jgi:hypothetical protein
MQKSRLRVAAPTSVNVTVARREARISHRAGGRAAYRGRQAEPLRVFRWRPVCALAMDALGESASAFCSQPLYTAANHDNSPAASAESARA